MAAILLAANPADRIDASWRQVVAAINQAAARRGAGPLGFLSAVPYAQATFTTSWTSVSSLFNRWSARGAASSADADQYGLDATAAVAVLALT